MNSIERKQHRLDEQAVNNFKEYLCIPSVHPNVSYEKCVAFLWCQAAELDLLCQIHELTVGKPIVIITWVGEDPAAPSIMLNSHMDVVPAYEEYWTHPPFAAHEDEKGNIFGRGAQDTKGVGIQYLEAVRRMKSDGIRLRRTIHISYMPDEEIGGKDGMKKFVHTEEFQELNIGFAFDEGLAHPNNIIQIVYGERSIWQFTYHCTETSGPSHLLLSNTAGEKIRTFVDKMMDYRQKQKNKLESNPTLTTGDITSVNMTMMKGGDGSIGEVPEEFSVTFDMRLAVTQDNEEVQEMLNAWCAESGQGTYLTFGQMEDRVEPTKLDDSNPWWILFKTQCDKLGLHLQPVICPAAGDSRYLRKVQVPTLGFAPMCHTPVRMHDHDEFLNKEVFLRGIDIYCQLISAMANLVL